MHQVRKTGDDFHPSVQGNRGCNQILCHLVRNDYHQRYNNKYQKPLVASYGRPPRQRRSDEFAIKEATWSW